MPKQGPGSKALVLGGGGVTGIAWTTGLLLGLEDEGVRLSSADAVFGTSAGATVGAQLTSGVPLSDLFDRQVNPARQVAELTPRIRYLWLMAHVFPALLARNDPPRIRARIGRMAMGAKTVPPEARRAVIEQRLPSHDWPDVRLAVAAIDAESAELRWLDAESGVSLVDAVAASCAVPGVWPLVEIDGRRYYDGGVPSADNAEGAAGCESIIVVSPMGGTRSGGVRPHVEREVAALEGAGGTVTVLTPDKGARAAMGRRALNPALRPQAAEAGREQGTRAGSAVAAAWE